MSLDSRDADASAPRTASPAAPSSAQTARHVRPAQTTRPSSLEVPALSHADYAAFSRQGDAQLLACCEVETFHASGPGGQGVNTADSAVRMRHLPTGIVVTARSERSQLLNRQACLGKLRAELLRRSRPPKPPREDQGPPPQPRASPPGQAPGKREEGTAPPRARR